MFTGSPIELQKPTAGMQLFRRILVGVDESAESLEAARQAAVLSDAESELTVLGAWCPPPPMIGVVAAPAQRERECEIHRDSAAEAVAAAESALATLATPMTKVVRGFAWDVLLTAAEKSDATLVAVGSHGQGRVRGILIGSTATHLLHKAPCSLLIARATQAAPLPRRIVVGIDGSLESAAAYDVACSIAQRFESELWPVVAHGGDGVDGEAVDALVGHRREDSPSEPVAALVAASTEADLIVLGSRGLDGLKALGSVSERVAHRARCSTLVVRPPVEAPARRREE